MNKLILLFAKLGNSTVKRVIYTKYLGVRIGDNVRFTGSPDFGSEPYLISIGSNVTITQNVTFHTHDGGLSVLRKKYPRINKYGRITIGDNVFIGSGVMIMPNVDIGDNVIIAAGSIVTKSVSSDSVVGGVPAKLLKTIQQYERDVISRNDHIIMPEGLEGKAKEKFIIDSLKK
ncbi:acyltransferase [Pedobacter faecalis]|uniref:acyltransferase n=1 Tax=Pedobacter faecalis TaxID=3041495 RepID=UPI00254B441B|nr:acyltransferase [Pedobacter sp. ELA7]